ncbi:MAG TPA: hypothetical protein VN179_03850, partial [Solirubrobacterales bacterium]|nr:hypothetical protein [Solirubrobacterales bacterium]
MSADATDPELKQEKGHGRGLSRLLRRRSRRPGAPTAPPPLPAPDPVASSRRPRPLPPLDDFAPTPFER